MGNLIDCIVEEFQIKTKEEEDDNQIIPDDTDASVVPAPNRLNLTSYGQEIQVQRNPEIKHYFDNMIHTDKLNQTYDMRGTMNI